MLNKLLTTLALAAAAWSAPTHAGVVTGNFDPPFGPALPGWSYKGTFTAYLPDYVVNLAQSFPTPLVAVSDGEVPVTVSITLFETANPMNQVTQSGIGLDVDLVIIDLPTGLMVGWNATPLPSGLPVALTNWNTFDLDPGAGTLNHSFEFSWYNLMDAPLITCLDCGGGANASSAGLVTNITQQRDNGASRGEVSFLFNANGLESVVLQPVPLPGTLALLTPALLALGLAQARRPRRKLTQQ